MKKPVPLTGRRSGGNHGLGICLAVLVVISMTGPSLGYASEVVIVPSSEATPYVKAQQAALEYFSDHGQVAEVIPLHSIQDRLGGAPEDEKTVVVAIGSQAATQLHSKIEPPMLLTYCMVANPAKLGLDKDPPLQGVSTDVPLELQFRLISQALPKARTIGMLYQAQSTDGKALLKRVQAHLPKGWQVKPIAVDDTGKYKTRSQAIDALFDSQLDIVWTQPDSSIYDRATVRTVLLTGIRRKVPVFGFSGGFVKAGALLSITVNPQAQGAKAAQIGLELLQQGQASNTANDNDAMFEIAVNTIVAEQLAVKLPPELIRRAKHIFKAEGN